MISRRPHASSSLRPRCSLRAPLLWVLLCLSLLSVAALPATASAEVPSPFWKKCTTGSGAGQCLIPRGIASDPDSGHVYVADNNNNRIDEFTAWGAFIRTWGWDVVASGPDDDTAAPEDEFEVCVPANGDLCKAGAEGSGSGQFVEPQGLTLDSGGDLYVADGPESKRRVQKFDPAAGPSEEEVRFVLMLGGKVNKTKVEALAPEAQQNICPVASGDVCQAATAGSGPGQFENTGAFGGYLATNPVDGRIYVGDRERIEVFEPDGTYVKSVLVPGEIVQSLTVDPVGDLYVSYLNVGKTIFALAKPNAHKLSASGASICTLEAKNPTAIATDPSGGVYVVDSRVFGSGEERSLEVRQFNSECADKGEPFGIGEIDASADIATSAACGVNGVDVYVSNAVFEDSFVKAYGPRPDPNVCPPPPHDPAVDAQYATSVGPDNATVAAQINPSLLARHPLLRRIRHLPLHGRHLRAEARSPRHDPQRRRRRRRRGSGGIVLDKLEPNTTYHYRFVSQSSGGGPVFGIDPDGEEGPKEASFAEGLEATFKTHSSSRPAESRLRKPSDSAAEPPPT